MKFLLTALALLLSTGALAQSNSNVDNVRLPQCEKRSDLEEALSRIERMKGFSEGDDYKFLKGSGESCGRYKVRSGSQYKLHSLHITDDNIFSVYEVTGGKGYEGGKVVGYVANGIYSKEGWRVASGEECVLTIYEGSCLLPKKCRAIQSDSPSYSQKLRMDEFAAPASCYRVGKDS